MNGAAFCAAAPYNTPWVAVEMGGVPLASFEHPERAIYLLGAEDHGLPPAIVRQCSHVVSLEAARTPSYNVAVAGSLVMYAAGQGQLASDGASRNGAFTEALLKHFGTPGQTLEQMAVNVRNEVKAKCGEDQTPTVASCGTI